MERGYIKINTEKGKTHTVYIQLVNNDLWLTKYEMAKLLNCFPQKIEANLRSIFKDNLLWENECTYNCRYTDKGIEKQCLYYNSETLIFVSYRINTLEAKAFQQFIHFALQERLQKKYLLPENLKLFGLQQAQMNLCWN
jgi:hypothetical protein